MKIRILYLTLLLVGLLALSACSKNGRPNNIPEPVFSCYEEYMDAFANDPTRAADLAFFPDPFIKQAYIDSNTFLKKFTLAECKKINEGLYVFTSFVTTNQTSEQLVHNFVALIDDSWTFVINVRDIPDNLHNNLVVSEYEYTDEDLVLHDDVLHITPSSS